MEYAQVDDLEAVWRPLTDAERTIAQGLLRYASAKMRGAVKGLDGKIAAGLVDPLDAEVVAVQMVKRAMLNGNQEGVTQVNDVAGPFTRGMTLSNPEGSLYLTADDRRTLGATRAQRAYTVDAG